MLSKFQRRLLVDLGEMEGDYRVFHLKDDILQSTLSISIAILSVLGAIGIDLLDRNKPDSFISMLIYQGGYVLLSLAILVAIRKTGKVRIYDRLMLGWLSLTIFSLLFFNSMRPANLLNAVYDVIFLFAVYILSPLKISSTIALPFGFSAGSLFVDHLYKTGL